MKNKVLSVSIASYNTEEYLEQTVSSLVDNNSRVDELEIIIVNDGSSDNTSAVAHMLKDRYPDSVVVIDKENGGYGSTINASLEIATGKYYKLLDGDDWYDPDVVEEFMAFLADCEADLVISPYYEVRDDKVIVDMHSEIGQEVMDLDGLRFNNVYFGMHEIAVRTEVLRDLGMQITEHCFYTDSEYVCYCFAAARTIARYEKGVYCYRLGLEGQSVSLSGFQKHFKDHPVVMGKIHECYKEYFCRIPEANRTVLEHWIIIITRNTFMSYLLLENPKAYRDELKEIDTMLKRNYPEIYPISGRSRFVRGIRMLKFRPYSLWCRYARNQYKG